MTVITFDAAYDWLVAGCSNKDASPNVLLGNGFSIAFDSDTFSYGALRSKAESEGLLTELAQRFFDGMGTLDFEVVIKSLLDAAHAIRIIRNDPADAEAAQLEIEAAGLKDALAQALAGLHPDRPHNIDDAAYERVYRFLAGFHKVYTVNYDMLLYWAIMRGRELVSDVTSFKADDGFREHLPNEPFVTWDNLHSSSGQSIFYIHGALRLFWGEGLLRQLTYVRTDQALLD